MGIKHTYKQRVALTHLYLTASEEHPGSFEVWSLADDLTLRRYPYAITEAYARHLAGHMADVGTINTARWHFVRYATPRRCTEMAGLDELWKRS